MDKVSTDELLRPIIGIENRTAQEVFDIMCDRLRLSALSALSPRVKALEWKDREDICTSSKSDRYIMERAMHSFGAYFIEHDADNDTWWATEFLLGEEIAGPCMTAEAIREEVQSFHDRRIMSAIEVSASPRVVTDEEQLASDILAELVRARTKFPGKNVTFAALVEEVGELATATFEETRDRVRKEAVQVAVMAMRMVLDGDHTFDGWREAKGLDPLTAALVSHETPSGDTQEDLSIAGDKPTHRHKKRGTEYVLLGIGKIQAGGWYEPYGADNWGSVDMREVAVYRSVTDPDEILVRPRDEFEDGRFEVLSGLEGTDHE